ncbi:DnaJ domain-containing protein [Phlyctochytrium arcticum]|nr:DnaJ domain-containing protein [Phlyctochytrium arcticum]
MGRPSRKRQPEPVESEPEQDDLVDETSDQEDAKDLYEQLNVARDCTEDEIKKAYRKLALRYHPDKLASRSEAEKAEATATFQKLVAAYQILSDPIKRKRYDETGSVDEFDGLFGDKGDATWDEYFRELWTGSITKETIEEFRKQYKGSEDERADILNAYEQSKGDMFDIVDRVPLAEIDEITRFQDIIREAVEKEEVANYKKFRKVDDKEVKKRKRAAAREAEEATRAWEAIRDKHEGGSGKKKAPGVDIGDEDALRALIQQRGKSRMDDLIAGLEAKARAPKKRKTKGK